MRKMVAGALVVLLLVVAMVFAMVQAQSDYFVLMLVCGGTYDSSNLHVHQADSEASAKAWADAEMGGAWDIAYIYDSWSTDGSMRLIWARSESGCYPDMRDWTRF